MFSIHWISDVRQTEIHTAESLLPEPSAFEVQMAIEKIKKHKYHVCGREELRTGFWWGNLRDRDHLEDPGVDGRVILRWIFRK
jgi:hypothetical protein